MVEYAVMGRFLVLVSVPFAFWLYTYFLSIIPAFRAFDFSVAEFSNFQSFQDSENDPSDSLFDPKTLIWIKKKINKRLRAIELRAFESAKKGDSTELDALRRYGNGGRCPDSVYDTKQWEEGPNGKFYWKCYWPADVYDLDSLPVILHIHGGGWVYGSVQRSVSICSRFSIDLHAMVISVNYSLSPEAAPGVALEECMIVWRSIPRDQPVIIYGDSAGGNLAAGLTLRILEQGTAVGGLKRKVPDGVILMYPVTDLANQSYFSWNRFADGYALPASQMRAFTDAYVPNITERRRPCFSPIYGNLTEFPPTLVIAAHFDILRDEARAFAVRLKEAGRFVRYRCIARTIHGFFSKPVFPREKQEAQNEIRAFVRHVLFLRRPFVPDEFVDPDQEPATD